jgi:hypothetical protein
MAPIHPDLLSVVDAVAIESPTAYTVLGVRRDLPTEAAATPDGEEAPPLVSWLDQDLYGSLYTRPPGPEAPATAVDWLARRDFVAALSAANGGSGTWEPGWTVGPIAEDGRIAVSKDGLTFWVPPEGLRAAGDRAEPGAPCRVRIGKEIRNLMPGFYVAVGDAEGDDLDADHGPRDPLVRYYWHLTPGAAAPLLAATTAALNALGVPFRIKVLSDSGAYRRADAGVLYLRRRYVHRAGPAVASVHEAVADGLLPEIPMFTKRLAPGLGLAEDVPDGRRSFGQSRCRLVAEALWSAFREGRDGRGPRADAVAAAFRRAGLDPARPYLEPGSRDRYAFRRAPRRASRATSRSPAMRRLPA